MNIGERILSAALTVLCGLGMYKIGEWMWFEYYFRTYATITPFLETLVGLAWFAEVFLFIGVCLFGYCTIASD